MMWDQGAVRVRARRFHSGQKERTHSRPMVTVFHSTMTTYLSPLPWSSSSEETAMSITMQQSHSSSRQAASSCFTRRLHLLITEVSQARRSVRNRLTRMIAMIRIRKKATAQGLCRGPVPLASMVPIVMPYSRIENCVRQQSEEGRARGQLACLTAAAVQRKMRKKMRARREEAMSMKQRKAMSCGQWQAVLVIVAAGQGFSWPCFTAMWQQQKGVRMISGTQTATSTPAFTRPSSFLAPLSAIILITYYYPNTQKQPPLTSLPATLTTYPQIQGNSMRANVGGGNEQSAVRYGGCKRGFINIMNLRSILGKVLGGLSNLSPVRNLIKYVLDRTLNELLSEQVSIEDFKNGELLLRRITLNVEKINRDYLLSSPYILHSGTARQLRVVMPNYSELSTRSVELVLEGLQLDLQPNRNFQDNFREAMGERQEEAAQASGPELVESNPMDFFRQLVKQIILNMKIRLENTAVRLFINEPKRDSRKPQYYLLLRAPLLSLAKSEDFQLPLKETVEEMKFDLLLPQLSAHLLREGTPVPEYANEPPTPDFPFAYPSVAHPGTLLLLGRSDWKAHMGDCSRLTVSLLTDYEAGRRVLSVDAKLPFLEVTVDPIQLKVLSRFLAQMAEFQRILKSVLAELGLGSLGQSVGLTLSRRGSKGKSATMDLFSSVALMIAEPQLRVSSGEGDLYKSIIMNSEMAQAATEFNSNALAQLARSGEQLPQGLRQVNFKQELKVGCCLGRLQLNLLKFVTATVLRRGWVADGEGRGVNREVGCAHFRAVVREVGYAFNSGSNRHDVTMGHAKLHDVRLHPMQAVHVSDSEEFYDVNSSTFEQVAVEQNYFREKPHLTQFTLQPQQHYCMEELFRCSQAPSPPLLLPHLRRHAFVPLRHPENSSGSSGLRVGFNGDAKVLQLEIREVVVGVNCGLWKDFLNIVYPVFLYRQLAASTDLSVSQIEEPARNLQFFESTYNFSGRVLEEPEREGRLRVNVKADLIYCLYRESSAVRAGEDLIGQVEAKLLDSDNFSRQCFCKLTERSLYAEISKLEFDHSGGEFQVGCGELKAGFMPIADSKIQDCPDAFLVSERVQVEELREEGGLRTRLFFPRTRLCVELPELVSFIDMLKRAIATADTLVGFQRSLAAKLSCIERELLHTTKQAKEKPRPQRVLQVLGGELEVRMLLVAAYLHTFYFRKSASQKELKLRTLALGLAQPIDARLAQFKTQLLTSVYPNTSHYPGIADSSLMVELGREAGREAEWGREGRSGRGRRRLEFFGEVERGQLSVGVFVRERVEEAGEKKFQFKKNVKRAVIEEEQRSVSVEVLLSRTLYLHANNLAYLQRQRQYLQQTWQKLSQVLQQIHAHSRQVLAERKQSIDDAEGSDTRVSLKGGQLFLDCRPDFTFCPQANRRVFTPSRFVLLLDLNSCKVIASPERQTHKAEIDCNVKAYFLQHADRDCELNPLLLSLTKLELYGFRSIGQVDSLSVQGEFNSRNSSGSVNCSVDSVAVTLCLSTLPLLTNFVTHFLNHTIHADYGMYDYEQFEVVEEEAEEEGWVDLTDKKDDYEKLIEAKKRSLEEFSSCEFRLKDNEPFQFHLKSLAVAHLKVELYGGQDFSFLLCDSLYESKAAQRTRADHPDTNNCLVLTLDKLTLTAAAHTLTKAVAEVEKVSAVYSFRRKEGLLYWETEKVVEFPILRVDAPLRLLLHSSPQALQLKLNRVEASVGFTDALLTLTAQFEQAAQKMQNSGWQKVYAQKPILETGRIILLLIPEGRLAATVEIKRATVIKEWTLKLPRLTIHELESNKKRSEQLVNDWISGFIHQNMGTIINGALFEALTACFSLITSILRTALSIPFPFLRNS